MALSTKKILKRDGSKPTEFEQLVANEIYALETTNTQLKEPLSKLQFTAAREIDIGHGRTAVLLFVPFPQFGDYRKIQKTFVEELEKKLSGKHVLVVANRTMISHSAWARSKKYTGVRPRSRTLKAVHDAMLDDLVFPSEIVGKRTRVRVDGGRITRVLLSPKEQVSVEGKLDTFAAAYKKLTSKEVVFEFQSA